MNVISLPENKQQMEEMYKNFFKNINFNNTMNGISLLQETTANTAENKAGKEIIQYEKIEIPTKGLVSTKVLPIKHNIIGLDLNYTLEKSQSSVKDNSISIRDKDNTEVNKRLYENFPRHRNLRTYEKEDLAEKKILEAKKKMEYEKNKAKYAKGFSFMQKQNKNDLNSFEDDNKNPLDGLDKFLVSSSISRNGNKISKKYS